jgi:hypothetical protein
MISMKKYVLALMKRNLHNFVDAAIRENTASFQW